MHTLPSQPPVPMHYSEAHWSWVHLQWHLPSAVHDCGEICWNLQGTVLNGSHWSTFAWHCDWHSQSAYHGPGDRQTLIYRWDEVGWVWLIDRLSLSHWGITKPSLHTRRAILFWVWVCARVRVLMPLHHCVFMDGFVSVAGQPYTDYPSHLEHSDRYRIRLSAWPSLLLQRLAELNKLSGRDSDRRLPDKNHIHSIDTYPQMCTYHTSKVFLCSAVAFSQSLNKTSAPSLKVSLFSVSLLLSPPSLSLT